MNDVPGPRLKLGWMVYVWLAMYVATFFQLAGIIGTIADVFLLGMGSVPPDEGSFDWMQLMRAAAVALSCAVLLAMGRYSLIERVSASMVTLFTLFTVMAVGALYWTDYAITMADLAQGFRFELPDDFTIAFAAFGIIGVGASELIYYPYWCLEKGYARHAGPNDNSRQWGDRAYGWLRVLKVDAWVSMIIYTSATVAFYLLGAAVLHNRQVHVTDETLVPSLSQMYSATFGKPGLWFFLIGAFVVLYSTVFIATASNGRLLADLLRLLNVVRAGSSWERDRLNRIVGALLPLVYLGLFLSVEKPLSLVLIGAVAQSLMLPLLCGAALYFHHRRMHPQLSTGWLWTVSLWLACIAMATTGLQQLSGEVGKMRRQWSGDVQATESLEK